jgi:hypothetical protein
VLRSTLLNRVAEWRKYDVCCDDGEGAGEESWFVDDGRAHVTLVAKRDAYFGGGRDARHDTFHSCIIPFKSIFMNTV